MITVVKTIHPVEVNGKEISEIHWGKDVGRINEDRNANTIRCERTHNLPTIVIPMCNVKNWEEQ